MSQEETWAPSNRRMARSDSLDGTYSDENVSDILVIFMQTML